MSIDVRQLTILSISPANTAMQVGDTLEVALGKVQGQINAHTTAIAAKADNTTSIINAIIFG